jgi:hypothetical protein
MEEDTHARTFRLVAFGMEKKGLTLPIEPISHRNFTLSFESFESTRRLSDFEGAIIFQGLFESFRKPGLWEGTDLHGSCNRRELDKRVKEVDALLKKGGFVCFVLSERFIEQADRTDFSSADLSKIYSNHSSFHRSNFNGRVTTGFKLLRNEFSSFLETYGAAWSYFQNYNSSINLRIIAKFGEGVVSFALRDKLFYVPALLPDNTPDRIDEFCRLLCDALISLINKLQVDIPDWVDDFRFEEEKSLISARQETLDKVAEIDRKIAELGRFKRIIVTADDALVDDVCHVLRDGFGLRVDDADEGREDLRILDETGKPIVFVEVKGTNAGVKREYISQTDGHRDRAQLPPEFPAVLVINTKIKNARTLQEKDQEIALEQVRHAAAIKVLIVRTIDLLHLLRLHRSGCLSQESFLSLMRGHGGAIRLHEDTVDILTGSDSQ